MNRKKYLKPQSVSFYINARATILGGSVPPKEDELIEGPPNDELEAKQNFLWKDDDDFESWDIN